MSEYFGQIDNLPSADLAYRRLNVNKVRKQSDKLHCRAHLGRQSDARFIE